MILEKEQEEAEVKEKKRKEREEAKNKKRSARKAELKESNNRRKPCSFAHIGFFTRLPRYILNAVISGKSLIFNIYVLVALKPLVPLTGRLAVVVSE